MKTTKKLCIALLSTAICAETVSGIYASGSWYWGNTISLEAPSGYTEIEDNGYLQGSFFEPYTMYQKINNVYDTDLCVVSSYTFNYTSLTMDSEDYDTYAEVYRRYEDQLDFDFYNVSTVAGKCLVSMYDNLDENENRSKHPEDFISKKNLLIQFCDELQELGISCSAKYRFASAHYQNTSYSTVMTITGIGAGEEDRLAEIAVSYDTYNHDLAVTTGTYVDVLKIMGVEITDDIYNIYNETVDDVLTYRIVGIEDLRDFASIQNAVQENYPDAVVEKIGFQFYDNEIETVSTEEIDLFTAEPDPGEDPAVENPVTTQPVTDPDPEDIQGAVLTYLYGDPDNDGKITIQDAYNTLIYYAKVSVGEENVAFTAAGDEAAEQAAFTAADVDKDGKITINDAYLILKYYATKSAGGTPSWDK